MHSSAMAADLPLNIEDLLSGQGQVKLDTHVAYANLNRSGVNVGQPVTVQISPTQFVNLPSSVGSMQINRDTSIVGMGLRYGLWANTEIYGRGNWLSNQTRTQVGAQTSAVSNSGFNDAWIGANYRVAKPQGHSPGLVVFGEFAIAEKAGASTVSGKSQAYGGTLYRVFDPVVLSVSGIYRHSAERTDGMQRSTPGALWAVSPQVSFAVNDQITLTTGVSWQSVSAPTVNGTVLGQRTTSTSLSLGAAFMWSSRTTLAFSTRAETSGLGGASINVSLQTELGSKSTPKSQH